MIIRLILDTGTNKLRPLLIGIFLIWQVNTVYLYSQSTDFINGKVINLVTSEPVTFATVKLKNRLLSVYTNEEGTFSLIKNSRFLSDSVIITSIGYKKCSIAFKELNDKEVNKIFLAPLTNGNGEVRETSSGEILNSVTIIRKAIRNILTKYPVKPFKYLSYCRDYMKKDRDYLNLNEAIIQIYDSGFTSRSISNKYRLLSFITNTDPPRIKYSPANIVSDSADLYYQDKLIPEDIKRDQYSNELFTLVALDPIRNYNTRSFSFIETFSENFIDNHNFSRPSAVFNDNLRLYRITFNGKTGRISDSLLVSGAIYINPRDYSIHKLEYSSFRNTMKAGLKKLFNFDVEYGYDNTPDSLMYPKYISCSKLFNVTNQDEKSYFRLLNLRWDIFSNLNPTLVLNFNNKIDPVIASQKENYAIMIGKSEIKIKNIQVVGEKVFIRFKNDDVKVMPDSYNVYVHKTLKDINGDILDKRKSMEIYQYRELFCIGVQ